MPKYSSKFKLEAVQYYLDGKGGFLATAKQERYEIFNRKIRKNICKYLSNNNVLNKYKKKKY